MPLRLNSASPVATFQSQNPSLAPSNTRCKRPSLSRKASSACRRLTISSASAWLSKRRFRASPIRRLILDAMLTSPAKYSTVMVPMAVCSSLPCKKNRSPRGSRAGNKKTAAASSRAAKTNSPAAVMPASTKATTT